MSNSNSSLKICQQLIKNIADILIKINYKGEIKYTNDQIYDLIGYEPEEVIGTKIFQYIHPDDLEVVHYEIENVLTTEEIFAIEFKIKHYDGHYIPVFVKGDSIDDVQTPSLALLLRDISKSKKLLNDLKRSKKEYQEAYNRTEFYKDLFAHDINNIFQNILYAIQLSNKYIEDSKYFSLLRANLRGIEEQVIKGTRFVKNIQLLSEYESEVNSLKRIEVNKVLKKSIKLINKSFPYKKINIKTNLAKSKFYCKSNFLLYEIFDNILINSIIYNKNAQISIDIQISAVDIEGVSFIKIEFADNGIGIDDRRKTLVFERNYKADASSRGMGLGLSLIKKIINLFKGKIWIENKVKSDYTKGTKFIIIIPRVE